MKRIPLYIILIALIMLLGCGGSNPRDTVKSFVTHVVENDSTGIDSLVDWNSMITGRLQDMSPEDSSEAIVYHRGNFIESLLDSGSRRRNYLNSQIVIGKAEADDSVANVEVSFIDRTTGVQNYTKMLLKLHDDQWKITYFY
ncbi:MAG: hypothetical protein GF307_07970 [candidate division Zixibacteria bacterium]|nr:hypothetical protein [candidate division Zixibacteria bacterium]